MQFPMPLPDEAAAVSVITEWLAICACFQPIRGLHLVPRQEMKVLKLLGNFSLRSNGCQLVMFDPLYKLSCAILHHPNSSVIILAFVKSEGKKKKKVENNVRRKSGEKGKTDSDEEHTSLVSDF